MSPGTFQILGAVRAWVTFLVVLLAMAPPAYAATYTWTGGGGNSNWSNPSNWGGSAPANGETGVGLVFPALGGHYASSNDLTGLHVTSLGVTTQLSGGSYTFTGNSITLSGVVTMASPGSGNPNLVWQIPLVLGGDVTLSTSGRQTQMQGPIDLANRTLTLDAEGDVVLAGVVSGSGNLIKNATSALTITGTNTYTGSTTGNAGALYIDNAAAFGGTGTGTTFNGGFLGFGGSTFTTSEPFVFNGGSIIAYGTPTMAGGVTLNTTIGIQPFNAPAALTIGGTIVGAGGLNKNGPGLLILNAAADAYEGATQVGNGTLRLDAALSSTNPVTVKSGAVLKGNASTAGTISVQSGGIVAPGSSPGQLSSAGLTMVPGATFAAEIDGPNPTTQYDQLRVDGPISLGGATLAVTLGYAPADGQEFTLIAQLQGVPATGTFATLAEGATFQVGGTTFGITYKGGSGGDVVLVAAATPAPTQTPTLVAPADTPTHTPAVATVTQTQLPTATRTGSLPPSSATPTVTPSRTASTTATATATATVPLCTGDCGAKASVTVDDVVFGVHLALEEISAVACPRFDADGDDRVTLPELLEAIENALSGCAP